VKVSIFILFTADEQFIINFNTTICSFHHESVLDACLGLNDSTYTHI